MKRQEVDQIQEEAPARAPLPKLLMTIDEAAQVLSLSRSLMYDLLMSDQIISIKIGRVRRVPVSALTIYVEHQIAQVR